LNLIVIGVTVILREMGT